MAFLFFNLSSTDVLERARKRAGAFAFMRVTSWSLVGSLLCASACAQPNGSDNVDRATLSTVVVTATRSEQQVFNVPGSINVIRVEAASSLGVNPSEYVQGIPGVLARDRQNYAQDEQISIRGFGARSTFGVRGVRLYVDGIPATMPDGQGQVSQFPLAAADRIEVLSGPFSALYGNASGGVIQIFTAEGGSVPELRLDASGGSYGTWRLGANARGREGIFGYNVEVSQFYTDGYRGHSKAERSNGNAKLTFDLGGGRKLSLLANSLALPNADDPLGLTRGQFETDPREPVASAVQFDTRKSVHQEQSGAILEQSLTDTQGLRVLGYVGHRDVQQFQAIPIAAQKPASSPGGVIDLDGDYGGADMRWSWQGALVGRPFDLTSGVSYDRQGQHRTGYNDYVGEMLGVQGVLRRDERDTVKDFDEYVEGVWDVGGRWLVSAGFRHCDVKFTVADHYIAPGNPNDSGYADYAATTPVAGVLYRASEYWHLYASYGSAFETPTFNELGYRPGGSAGLNSGLVPAHSRNEEVGAKWQLPSGPAFTIALFQANTTHEIAVATSIEGRTAYQNVDRARRRGVEFSLDMPLVAGWHAQWAYTYLDATFRSPFLTCPAALSCSRPDTLIGAGARIPGVPRSHAYAALRWGGGLGWNATIDANAASATPVNDQNTQAASGYASFGLGFGFAARLHQMTVSTFLNVSNVFNRRYVGSVIVNEVNGRYFEPGQGRALYAGVQLDWRR